MNEYRPATARRESPASRPPAMNGTASRNSTRRCRAGGSGSSTPRSSGRSATGSPIRPGRSSRLQRGRSRLALARRRVAGPCRPAGPAGADDRETGGNTHRGDRDRRRNADFAREVGRTAFADNCAPCHGTGGGGAKGFPNLNDDDWLWGGTSTISARRSSTASARRPTRSRAPEACRPLAVPACSTAPPCRPSPTSFAPCPACRPRKAPISWRAPRSSAKTASVATGRRAGKSRGRRPEPRRCRLVLRA